MNGAKGFPLLDDNGKVIPEKEYIEESMDALEYSDEMKSYVHTMAKFNSS